MPLCSALFRVLTPNSSRWSCPCRETVSCAAEATAASMPCAYPLPPHCSQHLLRTWEGLDVCSTARLSVFGQVIPYQCKVQLSCSGGRSLKDPQRRYEHFLLFFCLPSKQQEEVALRSPLFSPSLSIFGTYSGTHAQSNLVYSKTILW